MRDGELGGVARRAVEDYLGMEWVGFVDQLTKLTKGVAFYTSSDQLANCVMESYLSGRKKKQYIA